MQQFVWLIVIVPRDTLIPACDLTYMNVLSVGLVE